MVLICISLMISAVEHFFIYLFIICIFCKNAYSYHLNKGGGFFLLALELYEFLIYFGY